MSSEMLHKTAENALTVIMPYEQYLIDRARGLTGENGSTPVSLGDMAIKMFVFGALGAPHILTDITQEVVPSFQTMGDHVARQAEELLEVANWMDNPRKSTHTEAIANNR